MKKDISVQRFCKWHSFVRCPVQSFEAIWSKTNQSFYRSCSALFIHLWLQGYKELSRLFSVPVQCIMHMHSYSDIWWCLLWKMSAVPHVSFFRIWLKLAAQATAYSLKLQWVSKFTLITIVFWLNPVFWVLMYCIYPGGCLLNEPSIWIFKRQHLFIMYVFYVLLIEAFKDFKYACLIFW